jgi:ribosomal protein S18 acetylase RimI-like enzyme
MPELREFHWRTDKDVVLGFQQEIYETNFPGFRMTVAFLRDYEAQIRRATRHPGEKLYVLEDQSGVCGFIWLALITTMVDPFVGYIKNIYVAPRLRGQGQGKLLLKAADDWFRRHGCAKATLDASVCNGRAVDIYRMAGYEPTRYRMEKDLAVGDSLADIPGALL